jgi:hypothetical protein
MDKARARRGPGGSFQQVCGALFIDPEEFERGQRPDQAGAMDDCVAAGDEALQAGPVVEIAEHDLNPVVGHQRCLRHTAGEDAHAPASLRQMMHGRSPDEAGRAGQGNDSGHQQVTGRWLSTDAEIGVGIDALLVIGLGFGAGELAGRGLRQALGRHEFDTRLDTHRAL